MVDRAHSAKPRIIRIGRNKDQIILFTDGSCDPCGCSNTGLKAGYGAVMHDTASWTTELFGVECGDQMMERLTRSGKKRQVVGQSELLPVLAALDKWRDTIQQRAMTIYVDNEAARFALIKGSSPTRRTSSNPYWQCSQNSMGLKHEKVIGQ